jgi:hypothetical protein
MRIHGPESKVDEQRREYDGRECNGLAQLSPVVDHLPTDMH